LAADAGQWWPLALWVMETSCPRTQRLQQHPLAHAAAASLTAPAAPCQAVGCVAAAAPAAADRAIPEVPGHPPCKEASTPHNGRGPSCGFGG